MNIPGFLIIGLFSSIHTGSAAQATVVPKSVFAQVGTGARFNCTTMHNEPVYWTTTPYGSTSINDIYIGERFLLDDYGTSGRFSVEINSTQRRYDLLIQDVKQSDGGVYTCVDERGLGKKDDAELIVWDTLTCQEDQRQDSYMGDNVFDLEQDAISFTCRMNYWGNIRPQFTWSVGGRMFNGTQGIESGLVSSSLIVAATSKLDNTNISCEATISEDTRTGVIWTSGTIRVKYAVLKKERAQECPDVEAILHCNPPCSYKLETANGTQRCAIDYSVGAAVEWFYFYQSSGQISETDSRQLTVVVVLLAVSCFVLIALVIALGYFIKKLRHRISCQRKLTQELRHVRQLQKQNPNKNVKELPLKQRGNNIYVSLYQGENSNKIAAFSDKTLSL